MIDYLSEIPLPGRVIAPRPAPSGSIRSESPSLGFIAGRENRLVASTINRLMQSAPPDSRAPKLLALFGSTGTGKTHLSHGLVRHWNEQRGAQRAAYLTAGDFYRQLIDAIKRDAVIEFRRSLRSYELLAIDDLHELPDEDYVSQELRFLLDAYEENGATIIVTSRRPAATLANISPDVSSRLAAGLVLQLSLPGNAARVRIIHRASESLGRPLSEEATNHLASGVGGTANDLFGAVFELCASSTDSPPGAATDAEQFVASRLARRPKLNEILAVAARYFRLPQSQLKSASRRQSIVTARAIVVYLARSLTDDSYEQIGRALGGRDHTTIIHSYHKIERERLIDPVIQEAIDELNRLLLAK